MKNIYSLVKQLMVAWLFMLAIPVISFAHEDHNHDTPAIKFQADKSFQMLDGRFISFVDVKSRAGHQMVILFIDEPTADKAARGLALRADVLSALKLAVDEKTVTLSGPDGFTAQVPVESLRTHDISDEDRAWIKRNAAIVKAYPFGGSVSPIYLQGKGGLKGLTVG